MYSCTTWVLGEEGVTYCKDEHDALLSGCKAILMWIDEDVSDGSMTAVDALEIVQWIEDCSYAAAIHRYTELLYDDVRIDINPVTVAEQELPEPSEILELRTYLEEVRDGEGM